MMSKLFEVQEQISIGKCIKLCYALTNRNNCPCQYHQWKFHLHSLNGTGCKLGSFGRFENGKLYSNATTQQNKKEPGIVSDSKKNMTINLVF